MKNGGVMKTGVFLYDNSVPCDIRIVHWDSRPGTGAPFDEPEYGEDKVGDFYELQYGSTSERGRFVAGGGFFESVEAAMAHAADATFGTVVWNGGAE